MPRPRKSIVARIALLLALVAILLLGWAVWLNVISRQERQRGVEAFDTAQASFGPVRPRYTVPLAPRVAATLHSSAP